MPELYETSEISEELVRVYNVHQAYNDYFTKLADAEEETPEPPTEDLPEMTLENISALLQQELGGDVFSDKSAAEVILICGAAKAGYGYIKMQKTSPRWAAGRKRDPEPPEDEDEE